MTPYQELVERRGAIIKKLSHIQLPEGNNTRMCWDVGNSLSITGQTVQNYLKGEVKDGYLAEAIYKEFKKLKVTK